uniref:Uncharacterized protein T8E24.2 n=1 Tax=Arabidopsis thaliana TaxID=3702 RepID=Q9C840_ARATH|nr:hypothetical protein; 2231-1099 [Arabidopsis thaliana]
MVVPWAMAFILNTYCLSLHPLGQEVVVGFKRDYGMSTKSACFLNGLLYNGHLVFFMRIPIHEPIIARHPAGFQADILIKNVLGDGFVLVLWKYNKIVCEWYYSLLQSFFGEPPRLVGVAVHELGAIGRLLFFLDNKSFDALTISICVSFFFILLPFSFRWIAIAIVGGGGLFENSPVILGYMMTLSIPFAYLGIFLTLRQISFPAIVRNVGINKLPSMWLLQDVIGSIITTLLATLCIPYLLLKSLLPLLGFSRSANPAIEPFIWPALLALIAVWFMAKQTYDLVSYFHRLVFDDRYVVG